VAQQQVWTLPREERVDEATLLRWLDERASRLGPQQRKWVLDAAAVAAYHAEVGFPVVKLLICDDAPQFTWRTEELALCWVHEARHDNKLLPCYAPFQQLLAAFMDPFWDYYDALLAYREHPTPTERDRLWTTFDDVFVPTTGYRALDDRIAKTKEKKAALLLVLAHPEIPLHNNPAELGARQRVRKRDVSFGPRTAEGSKAWDTFMTLAATTSQPAQLVLVGNLGSQTLSAFGRSVQGPVLWRPVGVPGQGTAIGPPLSSEEVQTPHVFLSAGLPPSRGSQESPTVLSQGARGPRQASGVLDPTSAGPLTSHDTDVNIALASAYQEVAVRLAPRLATDADAFTLGVQLVAALCEGRTQSQPNQRGC